MIVRRFIAVCVLFSWAVARSLHAASSPEGVLKIRTEGNSGYLEVSGEPDVEWRFQESHNLETWLNSTALRTVFSVESGLGAAQSDLPASGQKFYRAVAVAGLFDTNVLRTIRLTFTNSNWASLLTTGRTRGSNTPCVLELDNRIVATNVGARYKGNTSFSMGGTKKSVNLDINWIDDEGRVMGFRAINLNNAAGDETIMREPLYFNILRQYAPCPHGTMARLIINGADWGVYSMVDQINNDLVDEWFPSHIGDRWRAPNIGGGTGGGGGGGGTGGGGGGGFASAASAFSYLGAGVSSYTNNYELKSDNSTNAWNRLVHAIDVLNKTSDDTFRDRVETAFAVDRWLWFLAVENVFVDDDSYWNKGADYAFYYEPESGRIHPFEHDGNEAFTSAMGVDYRLSPVQGASGNNRPLLYKFLSVPELRQRYLAHMRTVLSESFNPSSLNGVIDHFHKLSVSQIIADPKKGFTMSAYTNDLKALTAYVANRHSFLTNHAELLPVPPTIVAVNPPAVEPTAEQIPIITAQVAGHDSDGIDSVWLYWRDKSFGRFSSAQMFDDGAHGDGKAGDGVFGAATTNYPAGNKIHYYVEARSANSAKAAAFAPARAENVTYTYRVALAPSKDSPVVINELMARNSKTIKDPQGDYDDWIELRNISGKDVSLAGHYLTDSANNPRKWAFPADTVIPANGYLLIWADEDTDPSSAGLHANFKIDQDGERLLLIDTDENLNAVLDFVEFGAQKADRSYGRTAADSSRFSDMDPTPLAANH